MSCCDLNKDFFDRYNRWVGTVVLAGSNNRFNVSGDYEMGVTYCEKMIVGSDSTIGFYWEEDPDDPGGMYYPSLRLNDLEIVGDSVLVLEGYVQFSFKDNGGYMRDYLNHIKIRVGDELRNTRWTLTNGYYYVSGSDPWTPVPEPATYGAILGIVALGLASFRLRLWTYRRPLAERRSP